MNREEQIKMWEAAAAGKQEKFAAGKLSHQMTPEERKAYFGDKYGKPMSKPKSDSVQPPK